MSFIGFDWQFHLPAHPVLGCGLDHLEKTRDSVNNPVSLYSNGIDGTTGDYLVPPLEASQVVSLIKNNPMEPDLARWLTGIWRILSEPNYGLPFDVDARDVASAGWGIVFHSDEHNAVKQALEPLLEHRKSHGDEDRFKVLEYRAKEGRDQWLARHDVSTGSVEPWKVPFYLLLVGSPEKIPFMFASLLSVEYAVGRIDFETPDAYARYAQSVIAHETAKSVANARKMVFFAPRHEFDRATQLSAELLVAPLVNGQPAHNGRPAEPGIAQRWNFAQKSLLGDQATKAELTEALNPGAEERPAAFLFTASHGVGFPPGHPEQFARQGALVCQEWPGFGRFGPDFCFAAADLPEDARIHGLISFHFACFSGGTPSHDRYLHRKGNPPPRIAERPFIAALPRALMDRPGGGALACIGHVERAWGYSIRSPRGSSQHQSFRNAIGRILTGQPVGYAMKDFYERYASLSTSLNSKLEEISFGAEVPDYELAATWTERNDSEGYIVLGDPAVRLRVDALT
jgi:hypothetical protein